MTIRVLMLEDRASGASTTYAKGSQYDLPEATAALYIHNRWATYVSGDLVPNDAVPVSAQIDPVTGGIEILQVGGVGVAAAKWAVMPSGDVTGVTDTAAIQAAVAAAYAAGGGIVELAFGLFNLAANQNNGSTYYCVRLLTGVHLRGQGRGATTLKVVATSHAGGYPGHAVYAENASTVSVRDLTINGNRAAYSSPPFATAIDGECGSGVRLRNVVQATVCDNEIKACTYHGVLAVDDSSDITVEHNNVSDCGYRAIHFNTSGSPELAGSRIAFNYCKSNGAAADNATNSGIFVALNNTREIAVVGNHIQDEKNFALDLSGGSGGNKSQLVSIANNTVRNCPRGFEITTSAARIAISGNVLSGTSPAAASTLRGIGLTTVTNATIHGNVVNLFGYGIGLSSTCSGIEIADNICDDNATTGIYLSAHAHYGVGIRGNTIRNTGVTATSTNAQGIYLDSGAMKQVRIVGNFVEGSKGYGILIQNLSDSVIAHNILSNNYDGVGTRGRGIALNGTSDRVSISFNNVTNDGVSNNQNAIFVAGTTTNISVIENHAETTAATKIQVDTGATGRSYGNTGGTFSFPVGFSTGTAAL